MAARPQQVVTLTVHAQKALRMVIVSESTHLPFTSTGVLMGVLLQGSDAVRALASLSFVHHR